jgi:hypothetical protein
MKTTNQIEKALEKKIDLEISAIVASFISQLQDLYDTYGGSNYYTMVRKESGYDNKEISGLTKEKVRTMLQEMIKENHGGPMLAQKTNQLLAKLEIL